MNTDTLPDLAHSLQGRDLGHLRIVAQLWGLELNAPDARTGLQRLAPALLNVDLIGEIVADLPENAQQALIDLLSHEGRLPWAMFTLRWPGRFDRPSENPVFQKSAFGAVSGAEHVHPWY